jgi:predicted RNA-binding Zn-ribbon protein involved in translation (DUF1610 family)
MKPLHGLGLGAFGLCAGLLFSSGINDTSKLIAMGAAGAIPASFITYLMVDTKAQKMVNEAESKTKKAGETLHKVVRDFDTCKAKLPKLTSQLQSLQDELKEARNTINNLGHSKLESTGLIAQMKAQLNQLIAQSEKDKLRVEYLENECEQWDINFKSLVETEANKKFQTAKQQELEKIYQEHDSVTEQAMQLFRRLQGWSEKVAHGHQSKAEIIKSMAHGYNQNLDEINQSVDEERQNYLEQIEILHGRIGELQQQLQGDLVEPQYGDFGFNENGRIANAIAQWIWFKKQIPLKVTGFEEHDGTTTAGYSYSRSHNPDALVEIIKQVSSEMARNLGIYAIENVKKLAVTDCLVVKFRRDRPTRKADKSSLYRNQKDFIDYILSQPVRLRIVGEPGSGKSPTALVLMSHILKRGFFNGNTSNGKRLEFLEIGFCNPLAGVSVKNSDDLDFCLRWSDAKAGFKGLADEYKFRKSPDNAPYKDSSGFVWICDEFDNAVEQSGTDRAKEFKQVLKDGGHINLGVIILGQSGMVSTTKGLSIDDQKMLTNIYIDSVSIRTFLSQYSDRFYSKSAVEKALATLEQIELEAEEQNEIICDTAREFRIAMVTCDRSPVFYQLPYFDGIDIDVAGYEKSLEELATIRHNASNGQTLGSFDSKDVASNVVAPICPQCASHNIKRNGKAEGKQRYQCRDCGKNF